MWGRSFTFSIFLLVIGKCAGQWKESYTEECWAYREVERGCHAQPWRGTSRCDKLLLRLANCSGLVQSGGTAWRKELADSIQYVSWGMPGCPVEAKGNLGRVNSCNVKAVISSFPSRPLVVHVAKNALDWIHFSASAVKACAVKCVWAGQVEPPERADALVFDCLQSPTQDQLNFRFKGLLPRVWIFLCMESDVNVARMRDIRFMSLFDVRATYHTSANLPLLYAPGNLSLYEYGRKHSANAQRRLSAWVASNCAPGRLAFVQELMSYISVDSFGQCLQNAEMPNDEPVFGSTKIPLFSHYKFALSLENSITQDYVTEKFYHPLIAGSVPLYMGAPNVADFAPAPHSYIDIRSFDSLEDLSRTLRYLDQNHTAYMELHAWRSQPWAERFSSQARMAFNQGSFYGEKDMRQDPCRICSAVQEILDKASP